MLILAITSKHLHNTLQYISLDMSTLTIEDSINKYISLIKIYKLTLNYALPIVFKRIFSDKSTR